VSPLAHSQGRGSGHAARAAGSAIVAVIAISVVGILSPYLYLVLFANVYFSAALLSILVVQTWVRESWKDSAYVALAAAAIIAYQWAAFHFAPHPTQTISILGFCGFIALVLRANWAQGQRKSALQAGLAGACLLLLLYFFSGPLLLRTTRNHSQVLDLYLYSFDASLHVQFSFVLGALLRKWPLLNTIAGVFYIGLPVSLTVAFAGLIASRIRRGLEAIFSFCLGGPLAIFCYGLFPAVGPRALFQASFPFHPFQTQQVARLIVEPLTIHSLVNAMPSLHMTWALLAWWYSRGLSKLARALTAAFLFFTIISTMGMGEHYFVDLVVAFPFALFLESACSFTVSLASKQRLFGMLLGGMGTAVWFLLLRFETRLFWTSIVVPWLLVAGTVLLVLLVHSRLQVALDLPLSPSIKPSGAAGLPHAVPVFAGESCNRAAGEDLLEAAVSGAKDSRN
jgi:hypothetical protein